MPYQQRCCGTWVITKKPWVEPVTLDCWVREIVNHYTVMLNVKVVGKYREIYRSAENCCKCRRTVNIRDTVFWASNSVTAVCVSVCGVWVDVDSALLLWTFVWCVNSGKDTLSKNSFSCCDNRTSPNKATSWERMTGEVGKCREWTLGHSQWLDSVTLREAVPYLVVGLRLRLWAQNQTPTLGLIVCHNDCVLRMTWEKFLNSSNKRCTIVYKQSLVVKINCTKVKYTATNLHKSTDETDRAWSWSLLQMRDSWRYTPGYTHISDSFVGYVRLLELNTK